MKLLQKNTSYLLKVLPLVLLACTILFFLLLQHQTLHLQNEQLLLKQQDVLQKFQSGALQGNQSIMGEFALREVRYPQADVDEPADTSIYYPDRKQLVSFQMLRKTINQERKKYQLTVYVSSFEITHLKIAVLSGQVLIYLVLLYAIVLINRRLSGTLWKPFYKTMATLEQYDIHTQQIPVLETETGISEFDELNSAIEKLSERNKQAYNNQKQFVENASHEIQTPLAIIRSKVELLMEHQELSSETAGLIVDIADANNRLSKLNQALILLSKIQNNQFIERSEVDLSQLLVNNIQSLKGYYLDHMPAITFEANQPVILTANRELMDMLCSNLLRNTVIHNIPGGAVNISLRRDRLIIENTGLSLQIDPQLLFERFRTADDKTKKTTGLGLAIVKQICELHSYPITYTCFDEKHRITIIFF
jgi:signal transduction histidine kinase